MVQKVEKFIKPFYFFSTIARRHSAARWLVMAIESPGNFIYNLADLFDLDSLFIRMINNSSKRRKHHVKKYWIIHGVKDLLSDLANKFSMGLVSARDDKSAMAFVRQFELEKYFSVIVTSQTFLFGKGFTNPLLFAAEKIGLGS